MNMVSDTYCIPVEKAYYYLNYIEKALKSLIT